jgi:type II secretory pathway component PulK
VLGALTMRKGGERRRRTGIALIVAGLVVGLLSLIFYAIAASQGWL